MFVAVRLALMESKQRLARSEKIWRFVRFSSPQSAVKWSADQIDLLEKDPHVHRPKCVPLNPDDRNRHR